MIRENTDEELKKTSGLKYFGEEIIQVWSSEVFVGVRNIWTNDMAGLGTTQTFIKRLHLETRYFEISFSN